MNVEQIPVGFMAVFCYLIWCERTREALVIDPAGDEDALYERIQNTGLTLKYIINTHGHSDHTCGNARLKELSGAKIVIHENDEVMLSSQMGQMMARQWGFAPSPAADMTVREGDHIIIGDLDLEVIHTPGHSPGGMCLLGDGNVFTGDTLFVGAIGRTDLPGASTSQFMHSLKERLMTLQDETIVWPGHDYGDRPSSTIGIEKQTNPWLGQNVFLD